MRRQLKKFILCLACCCTLLAALPLTPPAEAAFAPPFEVNAEAVYMVNLDTGRVVYAKNELEARAPASLTKMMTSLLLMENVADLPGTQITAPGYIYDEFVPFHGNISTADIRPYETVTAETLLYAMLLPSANEAASIVADYLGGGNLDNFFYTMNARAKQLGCVNTNFTNAHGLFGMDQNHYSCAYDMYLIAKACYDTPGFMEVACTPTYALPTTNKHPSPANPSYPADVYEYIRTTNAFQRAGSAHYRSEVHGIKTGSTDEAGYNLVSTATRNGITYMLVVMGTPYEKDEHGWGLAFSVSAQLYDWAFDNFSVAPALDVNTPIREVSVKYADASDTVLLYPEEPFATLLPNEADESVLQLDFLLPDSVAAPIHVGDVIGAVKISLAGEELGTVGLVSHSEVERSEILYRLEQARRFVSSLYFRTVVALLAILVIGYIIALRALERKHRAAAQNTARMMPEYKKPKRRPPRQM